MMSMRNTPPVTDERIGIHHLLSQARYDELHSPKNVGSSKVSDRSREAESEAENVSYTHPRLSTSYRAILRALQAKSQKLFRGGYTDSHRTALVSFRIGA